jgi:hypothetical protein
VYEIKGTLVPFLWLDKIVNDNDIYIKKINMGIFDNDDEFNDDFMNRWENFNNRMMNDEEFRKEMERTQKEIQNMMRMFFFRKDFGVPLDFKIIPLNSKDLNSFNIPENEMDIEKGDDENGDWETKSWTSPDGSISYSSFSRDSSFDDMTDLPDEIAERWQEKLRRKKETNPEELKNEKLAKLKIMLDKAVEQELYEKAAEIKKVMDELKSENKNT